MTIRDRLLSLEIFGIKLGLANIQTLLAGLGHPERQYPTVHVAGTNGKGSVSAMTERALRAAGYRTGLYTSPHLDRLEERVQLGGVPVDAGTFDETAADVFATVDRDIASGRLEHLPTFFEVSTAIAFEAFRRASVDVAVVEVGLGGRFDATNVIVPRCCAITSIAFDHERHLGSTLAAIAGEKAGIVKPGVPVVVGEMPIEARAVIEDKAREVGAPVVPPAAVAAGPWPLERGRAVVRFDTPRGSYGPLRLALAGAHQVRNAAVALRLLETASDNGLPVDAAAIETGLSEASWPARLEWLRLGRGDLLVDSAHNPAGADALASYLREVDLAPLPMVFAVMRDKSLREMAAALAPVVSRFVATEIEHPRAFRAGELATALADLVPGALIEVEPDPIRAVDRALAIGPRAVVAGSIYLVGPLRARLIEKGAAPV